MCKAVSIHVRELLKTSFFKNSQVLAGENGLDRIVASATVIDTPDAVKWLKGNELILTTAYSVKGHTSAQQKLIEDLVDCGSAALAVKLRHLGSLPEMLKKRADELAFPIISIEERHSWLDVINYIRTLKFSKRVAETKHAQGIYPRFFERAFEKDAYQAIVDELYRSTGCPAFLFDFLAEDFVAAPHDFALPPHVSFDDFTSVDLDSQLFGIYRVKVYRWNGAPDQYSYLSVEIGQASSTAACICLWTDINDLHKNDWACLLNAATAVALEVKYLQKIRGMQLKYRSYILDQILYATASFPADVSKWTTEIGWYPKEKMAVVLMETPKEINPEVVENLPFFKNQEDCFYGWDRAGFLTVVLTFEHEDIRMELARQAQESFKKRTVNHSVFAGIGGVVDSISNVRISYDQASYALKVGKQLGCSCQICDYNELGVYKLLQYSLFHKDADAFYETYLRPLIEYGNTSGADLINTLKVFLESGLNYRTTAAKLFVHHNTVRYRIQRIEELCGVNLESLEDRLSLSIALKIMPFKTNNSRSSP
jgi:purine catabolism regulator